MGSNRLRKSVTLRRKLQTPRALNSSKSHVKKRASMFMDAFLYTYSLKLRLEALKRHYSDLLAMRKQCLNIYNNVQDPQEVKVEKTEEGFFAVSVGCEKERDTLVSVLQAFEELGLHVLQARVSCNEKSFSMEATTVAQSRREKVNAREVTEAITKATGRR